MSLRPAGLCRRYGYPHPRVVGLLGERIGLEGTAAVSGAEHLAYQVDEEYLIGVGRVYGYPKGILFDIYAMVETRPALPQVRRA